MGASSPKPRAQHGMPANEAPQEVGHIPVGSRAVCSAAAEQGCEVEGSAPECGEQVREHAITQERTVSWNQWKQGHVALLLGLTGRGNPQSTGAGVILLLCP